MANVYDEVRRLTKTPVLEALDGQTTSFDLDGEFGDDELIGGVRTIAYLAAMLPVGAPRRSGLRRLHRAIAARLANPDLLCFVGDEAPDDRVTSKALDVAGDDLFFRPARLKAPKDLDLCERLAKPSRLNDPFPSAFPAWKVWSSPGFDAIVRRLEETPVPEGRWEIDPRASAPELVERVRALHDLDEDAATLFLQLLTLADAADAVLAEINDWKPARYKAASAALVARGLVVEKKQPRANRRCVLPGTWETLKPPNPAIETWKLPLYDATMRGEEVLAPLGRLLPLRPVPVLFEEALRRHEAEAPSAKKRRENAPAATATRDWHREIAANPDDDALRLVYADWLSDHADPRGEFISVQIQLAERRADAREAHAKELRAAEAALLARHRATWTEAIHPFVKDVRFERGFVVGVTARPLTFAKHARAIFDACPLLHELVIDAGPVGPVQSAHWRELGACPELARITHLDTTSDHYIASHEDLARLLATAPRLRWLRVGYHRTNEGLGLRGAAMLAECERLSELRFLEWPGQNAGIKSLRALLESEHLAKLETLRVPYNGIKDAQAKALVKDLERGLAPALRTLDFSNTIASSFVTQAVARFARNEVSEETAAALASVFRSRASSPSAAR